jgi:uncharacterized Zn-binding protein involved in type VI secretion
MPRPPPAPRPQPPSRPRNALHTVSEGISKVVGLPSQGINLLNEGFAVATNSIAQALPSFPAATLGSLAIGIPHAHVLHPPSGPPPIPPTPMPVIGMVALGTSVQVLINGMPAARCGDLGYNPTCCGIPPIFEIFTGSSKVFIGGARAARMLDVTYHCKPVPPAGSAARGAAAAMQAAGRAMMIAGKTAQVLNIAGDAVEAVEASTAGDAAMASALGMSAGMMAAQMAADAVAMALGAAMGKDVCVPPGTLGAITMGHPNVLIGGFPMPTWMNVAKGLMKLIPGLKGRRFGMGGRTGVG